LRSWVDPILCAAGRVYADATLTSGWNRHRQTGFDRFQICASACPQPRLHGLLVSRPERSARPSIGDFRTSNGNGQNTFKLIVQEAFSSTLVDGRRVRVDLNQVGVWFADPAGDDFCLGANSPVTPFDGDNEAGVQAFNSANTDALPAP
jgi:hypothetical protein